MVVDDRNRDSLQAETKQTLEQAKLQEQIRTLKQQRLLAVLSAIGAVLAFFVINHTKIMNIVTPSPRLRLEVKDPYVEKIGKLHIESTGLGSEESAFDTSVKAARDWIPMKAGSYHLVLSVNDSVVFEQEVILEAGDKKVIVIPERRDQAIHVTVKNNTPRPPPGSPLQLMIESSGNGFLWIYDLPEKGNPVLVYPPETATGASHAITVGKTYQIPDSDKNAIFVANEPTEETLLVVVTSSDSRVTADKIASRMSKAAIPKASSGKIKENWGVSLIRYKVGI